MKEIASVCVNKILSDDFLKFSNSIKITSVKFTNAAEIFYNSKNEHFNIHVLRLIIYSTAHLSNVLKFSQRFILNETYYVENIKSTKIILGTNSKSTNFRIYELVIFNQTTKIDTHEEKYFHTISI